MGRKHVVSHKPDHEGRDDFFGLEFPQRLKEKTPADGFEPEDTKEKAQKDRQGKVVCLLEALPDLFPFDPPQGDYQTANGDEDSDDELEKVPLMNIDLLCHHHYQLLGALPVEIHLTTVLKYGSIHRNIERIKHGGQEL